MTDSFHESLVGCRVLSQSEIYQHIAAAIDELVVVLIAPNGKKYIANNWHKIVVDVWGGIRGYSNEALQDCKDGYKVWFIAFCDATGEMGHFLYPSQAKDGENITIITPVGTIDWIHGKHGLTEYLMPHYLKWLLSVYRAWDSQDVNIDFSIECPVDTVDLELIKKYR